MFFLPERNPLLSKDKRLGPGYTTGLFLFTFTRMKKSLLSKPDRSKLNEAVGRELYAVNMYKYFATCTQKQGLFGAQAYFLRESDEEQKHWKMIADFMNDMGDEAEMPAIPAIDVEADSLMDLLNKAFEVESDLGDFYGEFCESTKDFYLKPFLLKMIDIQRKAIGEYGDLIARLSLIGTEKTGLLIFDSELGK